jgi:hypothetical protein
MCLDRGGDTSRAAGVPMMPVIYGQEETARTQGRTRRPRVTRGRRTGEQHPAIDQDMTLTWAFGST